MKRTFLLMTLIISVISESGFAQDQQVLPAYLAVKEALTTDNAAVTAAKASELAKALGSENIKLAKNEREVLIKSAEQISSSKDIKHQRERFVSISNTLIELAKDSKLSDQKLYVMYCPMKKSAWLSAEKNVRNPYYGKSMLTCGTVKETLN